MTRSSEMMASSKILFYARVGQEVTTMSFILIMYGSDISLNDGS